MDSSSVISSIIFYTEVLKLSFCLRYISRLSQAYTHTNLLTERYHSVILNAYKTNKDVFVVIFKTFGILQLQTNLAYDLASGNRKIPSNNYFSKNDSLLPIMKPGFKMLAAHTKPGSF